MISIDFDRVKGYQSRVLLIIIFIIERWFGPSVGRSVHGKQKFWHMFMGKPSLHK